MNYLGKFRRSLIPTLYYIQSSNIVGISYDDKHRELFVLFGNKKLYKYELVDSFQYQDLLASPSKGKHLSSMIKKNHRCKELCTFNGYFVTDYKETKIVITDLDDDRGYVYIDGIKHKIFDVMPETINYKIENSEETK